jgi:hypothetical protein
VQDGIMGKTKLGKRKRKRSQDNDLRLEHVDEKSNRLTAADKGAPFPLTNQCHHYTRLGDVPFDIQK